MKAIPVLVDGKPFQSVSQAARELGLELESLRKAFQNGADTFMGLSLDYADWGPEEDLSRKVCPAIDTLLERQDRMHRGGLLGRTEVAR